MNGDGVKGCWICYQRALGGDGDLPEPDSGEERREITQSLVRRLREPDPAETRGLLAELDALVRRFVVLPSDASCLALSLFVLHTWAFEAAHATPYIVVESPEKRAGKTRLLDVLALVCRDPLKSASITAAAVYQSVEVMQPTLLIDEADAIFGGRGEYNESLRGVLNAGNMPGSPVIRGGKEGEPKSYDVFCPKVIAGIATGKLPDTIRDRAIVIPIDRKLKTERVERLRHRRLKDEISVLRERFGAWAQRHEGALAEYELVESMKKISDRLEEAWEPLMGIADLAGGEYPQRTRKAALELAGEPDEDEGGASHVLLIALYNLFGFRDAMFSKDIVAALNREDSSVFREWNDGAGIKQAQLAVLLKPYRIKPRSVRVGDKTAKGYLRKQFKHAWERYGADFAVTPVTSQRSSGISGVSEPSQDSDCDGLKSAENTRGIRNVTGVTAKSGETGAAGKNDDLATPEQEALAERLFREYGEPS